MTKPLSEKIEEYLSDCVVNNLNEAEMEILQEAHMEQYIGFDDDAPEDFEAWLVNLTSHEIVKIIVKNLVYRK